MPSIPRIPIQGLLFILSSAAAALCIDFSGYHELQHADSLLPVMVSLYKWEPFLWTQSRLGMLLPAVALPFKHPFWNLIVQNGAGIFGALAAMGCVTWYLLRDRTWAATGALAAIVFVVCFPLGDRFHLTNGSNPYPIPLGLSTLAITIVSEGGSRRAARWAVAGLLTAVAYWYNFGIGTQMALLAGGRFFHARIFTREATVPGRQWGQRGVRELAFAALLTLFGSIFGYILMNLSPNPHPSMSTTPVSEWPDAWYALLGALPERLGHAVTAMAFAIAFGTLWLILPATRPAAIRAWGLFAVLIVWLGIQLVLSGTLYWVKINDYDLRYIYPGLIGTAPAAAILALMPPLVAFPRLIPPVAALLLAALPACAVGMYGQPSEATARSALERAVGYHTADLLDAGCTHVVGDFWPAWAATFHANMVLADRGDPRTLWAVTQRGDAAWCRWRDQPHEGFRLGCVAVPGYIVLDRPTSPYQWNWAFSDVELLEHRGRIAVFKGYCLGAIREQEVGPDGNVW